jgi:maltose alpha-D-glucosyltransferase / alpha-amylase
LNHTSKEHYWFKQSSEFDLSKRNYYIWSENDEKYVKNVRLLLEGLSPSNWTKYDEDYYFYHRFFEHQPDLNYKNPHVLLEISNILIHWILKGVDGVWNSFINLWLV